MTDSPAPAPRRWRLQFSLRLLLLAFTAFAIGFPVWYRWPFEETEYRYPNDDKTLPPVQIMTRTWRRTWGGGKVREGRSVSQINMGRTVRKTIEHYADDAHHGPFETTLNGKVALTGQYERGDRTGTWTAYNSDGSVKYVARWKRDRLDGLYEGKQEHRFADGRLVDAAGQPIKNRLIEQMATIDDERIYNELEKLMPVGMEFVETPLKDSIAFLQEQHGIPIILDTRRVADIDRPITLDIEGVDLRSALALLTPPDLAFEYRCGVLFLTTAENVNNSRDATGVADIRPPINSPLAQAWNEPVLFEVVQTDLQTALEQLAGQVNLKADLSALPAETKAKKITFGIKGLPLRHVLGLLLDREALRCEARGNDTLVILPEK